MVSSNIVDQVIWTVTKMVFRRLAGAGILISTVSTLAFWTPAAWDFHTGEVTTRSAISMLIAIVSTTDIAP